MNPIVAIVIAAALGLLGRTLVPYLQTLRENPETKFDSKFLVPPVVSCVIALITLPLTLAALPKDLLGATSVTLAVWVGVFVAAWGTTDLMRTAQKLIGA